MPATAQVSTNGPASAPRMRLADMDDTPLKPRRKRGPSRKTLVKKAARILELKASTSELYQEIEALQNELVEHLGVGNELPLGDGVVFEIVDPFVDENGAPKKFWRHVPVGRYDFQTRTPRKSRSSR